MEARPDPMPQLSALCRQMENRVIIASILLGLWGLLLGGCTSGIYEPCTDRHDCDGEFADGCAHEPQGGPEEGWCTVLCNSDDDCPLSGDGKRAVCKVVGKYQVCKLP